VTGDVRDLAAVDAAMTAAQPEIVIHMAAQTLVRPSYDDPVATFASNVMGTVHVLDAVRRTPSVRAVVVVTSDKCYHNEEWVWGYREDARLGGRDPYSASKGAAELVVAAYQSSFFSADRHTGGAVVASARAGNVIGGGDWATDRLVPDVVRALLKGEPTLLRNPQATRPWQHVLEPLDGYLTLAERLWIDGHGVEGGWNFGPSDDSERSVGWIVGQLYERWGADLAWEQDLVNGPPESTFLKVDASKARAYLGWRPKLDLPTTLQWIVDWTRRYEAGADVRAVTLADIDRFSAIEVAS
jgi:CDP-glucose 4,6-dehydratase